MTDQRHLALIFATVQDAVVLTCAAGRIIDCNPAAERLLGSVTGTTASRASTELAGMIDPLADEADRAAALRHGRWEDERSFVSHDGRRGLLHATVIASADDAGTTTFVCIYRDLTEQKSVEETLRENEKRLRFALEGANEGLRLTAILDATPDLVATSAADFTTLYMNPAGRRMLGLDQHEDLTGRWIGATYPAHVRQRMFDEAIPTAVRDGFWRGESAFIGADGREHPATQIVLAHRNRLGKIEYFSTVLRDDTERLRAESVVRESEERHRLLFEENPIPLLVIDAETLMFLAVNAAAVHQYGYSRDEFARMSITDIRPAEDAALALARAAAPFEIRSQRSGPYRHQRKDGSLVIVDIVSRDFAFAGRNSRLVLAIDVTEQRHLEDQLRQSQKIEAVGQLAGGVAHDFNNLLTIIKGNVELALQQLPTGVPLRDDLEQVAQAASRAALLTRQLLAFGRKQVLTPVVLDLNEVVAEAERMLRRVIGEDIRFVTQLAPTVSRVTADRGQIEQVLVNLVVNARDAMPTGGVLTVATRDVTVSFADATARGIVPGSYVTLCVHDTGTGMDEETRSRIFEPFFTTKPVGHGTGLGLATVYGVVNQSGGFVSVDSKPGVGSTFTIHLPRSAHVESPPGTARPDAMERGSETVLLVEDEDEVRSVARRVLTEAGYTVLEAANAAEAIDVFDRSPGAIAALVSDVVMPGLNGHELSQMLRLRAPRLPTLFVSGYSFDARESAGCEDESFLEKPYDPAELARRVRSIIDATAMGSGR